MKVVNSMIALALMAATIAPVMAKGIDVKVIGTIAPVACTPTLSGGGTIDYGNIPTSSLSQTEYTLLDEKQLDFAITCEAPVKLALKASNGRPGTLAGASEGVSGFGTLPVKGLFGADSLAGAGLGLAGEAKIGGYAMRLAAGTMTADSVSVDSIQRSEKAGTWASTDLGSLFASGNVRESSWAATGTIVPLAFTNLVGKLGVQAYINKASELDLTQTVTLDGLTTLELVYM